MNKTDFFESKFQMMFLPPVFGLEFCIALLGNTFALWLMVTRERRDWHSGVVFSCNLAISDLLYVFTLPMLALYYTQEKNWTFGTGACKVERFLFTCNLYVSILFITCISLNRYLGIVHPFFVHRCVRPYHAKIASLLTWVLVSIISSPVLYFAGTCPRKGTSATECVSYCRLKDERSHFHYSIFLAVFGGLLPFLLTLLSYVAIVWVVWRNQNITMTEKKKVALLVISVLVLYTVSVIPYHTLRNQYLYHRIQGSFSTRVYKAYQVTKGLVTISMCIHPVLYMAVFDSIRTACCGRGREAGAEERGRAGDRKCSHKQVGHETNTSPGL